MKLSHTQYRQEFSKESVKFFKDSGLTLVETAKRLSLPKGTLKNSIYADNRGELAAVGKRQKTLTEVELSRVKREFSEVKMERDFIKKVCDVFRQVVAARYDLIESMRQSYPIVFMCQLLDASENGFHARSTPPLCRRKPENARLGIEILAARHRTRETYSAKGLYHDLADHGIQTMPYRVQTLHKKLGLRCKQKLTFKVATESRHHLPVAPIILDREFTVNALGKVWVSDITYIPTDEGWFYLAGVNDLFNGELVSYAMSEKMTRHFVIQALFRATSKKHPDHGLTAHSDQGSQYCAHDYQNLLQQLGVIASMSRKEDCYDNAPMESFWGNLKPNWCIIGDSKHGNKPFRKLPNKSNYSKTDSASKKN